MKTYKVPQSVYRYIQCTIPCTENIEELAQAFIKGIMETDTDNEYLFIEKQTECWYIQNLEFLVNYPYHKNVIYKDCLDIHDYAIQIKMNVIYDIIKDVKNINK